MKDYYSRIQIRSRNGVGCAGYLNFDCVQSSEPIDYLTQRDFDDLENHLEHHLLNLSSSHIILLSADWYRDKGKNDPIKRAAQQLVFGLIFKKHDYELIISDMPSSAFPENYYFVNVLSQEKELLETASGESSNLREFWQKIKNHIHPPYCRDMAAAALKKHYNCREQTCMWMGYPAP